MKKIRRCYCADSNFEDQCSLVEPVTVVLLACGLMGAAAVIGRKMGA